MVGCSLRAGQEGVCGPAGGGCAAGGWRGALEPGLFTAPGAPCHCHPRHPARCRSANAGRLASGLHTEETLLPEPQIDLHRAKHMRRWYEFGTQHACHAHSPSICNISGFDMCFDVQISVHTSHLELRSHPPCAGELVLRERAVAALPRDKFAAGLCHGCFQELKGVPSYRVTFLADVQQRVAHSSSAATAYRLLSPVNSMAWSHAKRDGQLSIVLWRRCCRHKCSHALLQ